MIDPTILLLATVLTPFFGLIAIMALSRWPNAREGASLATAILTFAFAALMLPEVFSGSTVNITAAEILPGLKIAFWAEPFGVLFATLASFLWIFTTIYSIGYMRGLKEHAQTRYYSCFAIVIGATMGIALSSNLFSLFIFYEILTIATYPLVAHKETDEAFKAGRKYLIFTLTGGLAILAGLVLMYVTSGTVDFVAGGQPALFTQPGDIIKPLFVLLVAGFGVKATLMPLHSWLPTAMIAPTPVSGLLHAVAVVKAGVFGLLRVVYFVFGPMLLATYGLQIMLIVMAIVTIIVASLIALVKDDIKARLAYSTISQLSYIVLGAALLTPAGLTGSLFQIAAHAFAKLTMFFVAGAILVTSGKTKISQLDGIAKKMPISMAMFTIAAIGMVGLPPLAGFGAKWFIAAGVSGAPGLADWAQGALLLSLVASSVLNAAYFFPIIFRAYFGKSDEDIKEAPWKITLPLTVTAIGAIVIGIWTAMPDGWFNLSLLGQTSAFGTVMPQLPIHGISYFPPFLIFLIGAPLIFFLKGKARKIGLIVIAGLALLDVFLMPTFLTTPFQGWSLDVMGFQLTFLNVDSLSLFTGYIFVIITFLATIYLTAFDVKHMELFALLYAGTSMGAVFAGDFLTLLIFWEAMALTSTALIVVYGGDAVKAGFRYLLFHVFGGSMFLAGIAVNYIATGSLALGPLAPGFAFVFGFIGIAVNLAMVPFHTWLPDTYPRPHVAASVFLSVYTTKAAVYALARVILLPNGTAAIDIGAVTPYMSIIAYMGGIMAVYGVSLAVVQTNMRKLLSYHIVSQVGYMVAGVGMAFPMAVNGGMAHVFNHILYKALLFMTVGAVIYRTQQEDMSKVGGLWKAMPITAIAFWIAAFSISGVPLFNGFVSKGMVITSAAEGNAELFWLRILLEIASFGTFLSFLKMGWFVFIKKNVNGLEVKTQGDAPLPMKVAMIGTAILCVAIGVYPALLFNIMPVPMNGEEYVPYALEHVLETLLVLGAAALFFFTVGVRILQPKSAHEIADIDEVYKAGGKAVTVGSAGVSGGFGYFYQGASAVGNWLISLGRRSKTVETRDINWNLVAFALLIVLCIEAVLLGVS